MSIVKNFGLTAVGSSVQFGKDGGLITFDSATQFFSFVDSKALVIPVGTDADRPATPVAGMLRIDATSTPRLEFYGDGTWNTAMTANTIIAGPGIAITTSTNTEFITVSAVASGTNGQLQYNSSGTLTGTSQILYNGTNQLTVGAADQTFSFAATTDSSLVISAGNKTQTTGTSTSLTLNAGSSSANGINGGNVLINAGTASGLTSSGGSIILSTALNNTLTERLKIDSSGAIAFNGDYGVAGLVLTSNGPNSPPSWQAGGAGGGIVSVDVSGGSTGLTTTGGPINVSNPAGTITLTGTLSVANGGTGRTTVPGAPGNLLFNNNGAYDAVAGVFYNGSTAILLEGVLISSRDSTEQYGKVSDVLIRPGSANNQLTFSGNAVIQGGATISGAYTAGNVILKGGTSTFPGVNGEVIIETSNVQRFKISQTGAIGLSGSNYGISGQVLTSSGPNSSPTWQTATSAGITSISVTAPLTITSGNTPIIGLQVVPTSLGGTGRISYNQGDILYGASGNNLDKLAIGTSSQVLTVVDGLPKWQFAPTRLIAGTGIQISPANGIGTVTISNIGSVVGGINGQLQFNSGGSFAGTSKIGYNSSDTLFLGTGADTFNIFGVDSPNPTVAAGTSVIIKGGKGGLSSTSAPVAGGTVTIQGGSGKEDSGLGWSGNVRIVGGSGGAPQNDYGYVSISTGGSSTERLRINHLGAWAVQGNYGTAGQVLMSSGTGSSPVWTTGGSGTVRSITVQSGTGIVISGTNTVTTSGTVIVGLQNTGVTPGTYTNANIIVGADGRIISASNGSGGGGGGGGGTGTVLDISSGGTGANTAQIAINNLLPQQAGNSGKYLQTDGANVSWQLGGTVYSVGLSGGATGLSTIGSPITGGGTISLSGVLNVASGGTGATNKIDALNNLLPTQAGKDNQFLINKYSAAIGYYTDWSPISSSLITAGLGYVPVNRAGDDMTGALTLPGNPTLPLQAATKQYVDNVAAGLTVQPSCLTTSEQNYVASYDNGVDGVGATLNGEGVLPVMNGVTLIIGNRVLIKDQTDSRENGVYTVTIVSPNWQLTRATDFDDSTIKTGYAYFISDGDLSGTIWVLKVTSPVIIGGSSIEFNQFASPIGLVGGQGISIAQNVVNNTGVLKVIPGSSLAVNNQTGNVTISFTGDINSVVGVQAPNKVLRSNGSTISLQSVNLVTDTTGILEIENGGTGANTSTDAIKNLLPPYEAGKFLYSDGTNLSWLGIEVSGSGGQLQWNNNGIFSGTDRISYNGSNQLSVGSDGTTFTFIGIENSVQTIVQGGTRFGAGGYNPRWWDNPTPAGNTSVVGGSALTKYNSSGNYQAGPGPGGSVIISGGISEYTNAGPAELVPNPEGGAPIRINLRDYGGVIISTGEQTVRSERLRITYDGLWGLNGRNYGDPGQVLTSYGEDGPPQWVFPPSGSVKSVEVSGGETGITFFGGPITTVGTMTMTGTLGITYGGTGATNTVAALNNLLPNQSGNNGRILATNGDYAEWVESIGSVDVSGGTTGLTTSGGPITTTGIITIGGTLNITNGGTGATNPQDAINALMPNQFTNGGKFLTTDGTNLYWQPIAAGGTGGTVTSVNVSGGGTGLSFSGGPVQASGTITMSGTLAIASGGTGATTRTGAINALLPTQSGNSSKYLVTNGVDVSWEAPLPSQTGNANKYLRTNGTSLYWDSTGAGIGSVTSVDVSGGDTGLSFTGGPVTISGTVTMTGTLAMEYGGTGANNPQDAVNALFPIKYPGTVVRSDGTNIQLSKVNLFTDTQGILPVEYGGTGADSQQDALDNITGVLSADPGQTLVATPAGSDGLRVTWKTIVPDQEGQTGTFLYTDGTNTSWRLALPEQQGYAGKYLTTDGITASWTTVIATVVPSGSPGDIQFNNNNESFAGTSSVKILNSILTTTDDISINGVNIGKGPGASTTGGGNYNERNTAVGVGVLQNNGLGSKNTGIGYNALADCSRGSRLVAVGSEALANTGLGVNDVAVGAEALFNLSDGANNIALGYQAGYNIRTNSDNIAIGTYALSSLQFAEGTSNIAIGTLALRDNRAGRYNIAIGEGALTNANYDDGSKITTEACRLTAIGYRSLYNNTLGYNNTAYGYQSLYNLNSGYGNTAIGYESGINLVSGNNNTIIGSHPAESSINNTVIISAGTNERLRFNGSGAMSFAGTQNYGTSGQVLQSTGPNTPPVWSSSAAGIPGGTNGQVQFNSSGDFGGASDVTYSLGTDGYKLTLGSPDSNFTLEASPSSTNSYQLTSSNLFIRGGSGRFYTGYGATRGGNVTIEAGAPGPGSTGALPTESKLEILGSRSNGSSPAGYIDIKTGGSVSLGTNQTLRMRFNANGSLGLGLSANTGATGQFLMSNGPNSPITWGTVDALPSQTGNSGKYLSTNGTTATWVTLNTSGQPQGANLSLQFNNNGAFGGSSELSYTATQLIIGSGTGTFSILGKNTEDSTKFGTSILIKGGSGGADPNGAGAGNVVIRGGDGQTGSISGSGGSVLIYGGTTALPPNNPAPGYVAIFTGATAVERFRISDKGSWGIQGNYGTNGQVLTSTGENGAPTWTTQPFDISFAASGFVGGGNIFLFSVPRAFTLPAGLTGSFATALVAAAADTTMTINRRQTNGTVTNIGSILFASGVNNGTFTFANSVTFAAGDVLYLTITSIDTALSDVAVTFAGTLVF